MSDILSDILYEKNKNNVYTNPSLFVSMNPCSKRTTAALFVTFFSASMACAAIVKSAPIVLIVAGIIFAFAAPYLLKRIIDRALVNKKDESVKNSKTRTIECQFKKQDNGEYRLTIPASQFEGYSEEGREEVLRLRTAVHRVDSDEEYRSHFKKGSYDTKDPDGTHYHKKLEWIEGMYEREAYKEAPNGRTYPDRWIILSSRINPNEIEYKIEYNENLKKIVDGSIQKLQIPSPEAAEKLGKMPNTLCEWVKLNLLGHGEQNLEKSR